LNLRRSNEAHAWGGMAGGRCDVRRRFICFFDLLVMIDSRRVVKACKRKRLKGEDFPQNRQRARSGARDGRTWLDTTNHFYGRDANMRSNMGRLVASSLVASSLERMNLLVVSRECCT